MKAFFIFAVTLLAASQAVEFDKQENVELLEYIQTVITNHIHHVLHEEKPQEQATASTGHVPHVGDAYGKRKSTVALPNLDLLPPHAEQPRVENYFI